MAGTVGDYVGNLGSGVAEKQRLEASEDAADSKVDFLARIRRFGLVLIGRREGADCVPNVGWNEGGEVGSCSEGLKTWKGKNIGYDRSSRRRSPFSHNRSLRMRCSLLHDHNPAKDRVLGTSFLRFVFVLVDR